VVFALVTLFCNENPDIIRRNVKPENITTYQNRTQAKTSYNPFLKAEADGGIFI